MRHLHPSRATCPHPPVNRQSPLLALAPTLCAIHCLAAPIVAAAAPALGNNPAIEWGALVFSLAAATFTFRHRSLSRLPAVFAGAGCVVWVLSRTSSSHPAACTPVLVGGSITVAVAMLVQLRVTARGYDCHCHACVADSTELAPPGERAALG